MRLIVISDTHGRGLSLPDGDVLIHCGDLSACETKSDLKSELRWLGDQMHRYVLFVPGNHDIPLQFDRSGYSKRIELLIDRSYEIRGNVFYGTPWSPAYNGWGFGVGRDSRCMIAARASIPHDVEVLITHCPPHGILDQVSADKDHLGCLPLRNRVDQIKPRVHCFGHVHGGYGRKQIGETLFVNASSCTERYVPDNPPQVIDL